MSEQAPVRVLMCVPDAALRDVAHKTLHKAGAVVDIVADGQAALGIFEQRRGYAANMAPAVRVAGLRGPR